MLNKCIKTGEKYKKIKKIKNKQKTKKNKKKTKKRTKKVELVLFYVLVVSSGLRQERVNFRMSPIF